MRGPPRGLLSMGLSAVDSSMAINVSQPADEALGSLSGWCYHGSTSRGKDEQAGTRPRDAQSKLASQVPRCSPSHPELEALLKRTAATTGGPSRKGAEARDAATACPGPRKAPSAEADGAAATSSFTFVRPRETPMASFDFWPARKLLLLPAAAPRLAEKRRRHRLDVDGPNTAALSCKKRRLRTELITSRLSQPYSQPATHILNREGSESGDKRFLKMAATLDVARRMSHLHTSSIRRFSIMNRLRRRLGLGLGRPADDDAAAAAREAEVTEMEDEDMDADAKAPWQQGPRPQPAAGFVPGRPALLGPAGILQRRMLPSAAKTPIYRLSKPAALPLPLSDVAATKQRTSPRIQPVQSPELVPLGLGLAMEEVEEDSFAYLHADDDSLGDLADDPELVYSDFDVVFAGKGESSGSRDQEEHSYEEYVDELDGISWLTR